MPRLSSPISLAKSAPSSAFPSLADHARATLRRLGYHTVHVVEGDGTLGWRAGAPYDAIVATARDRAFLRPCAPS